MAYTSSLRPAVLGRPVAVFSLLVAVSTTLGCGESEPTPSSTATTAAALYGAGVTVDMASTSGYRAAVGQIAVTVTGGGMSCSATALAPQTVLTAAHCVCDWFTGQFVGPNAITFFLPQGVSFSTLVGSYAVHPSAPCSPTVFPDTIPPTPPLVGPPDLAVLNLATPIPPTVLADFPGLHLGPTKADWDSSVLDNPSFQVGWGATNSYNTSNPTGGGTRRYGPSTPEPAKDPCDKPSIGPFSTEGPCNDYYQWEDTTNSALVSVHAPGDSGGPLYLTDTSTGQLILAGVSSGWHGLDPLVTTGSDQQVWAPTGNVGDLGNHTFLIDNLGGDTDGDLVPDAIDNCPIEANSEQVDDDNDGVGDECDNCAPAVCTTLGLPPTQFSCFNPQQLNNDSDGWGDTCDLCPENAYPQADDDGDWVGNVCDTCPESNPYEACATNADCQQHNAGFCISDTAPGLPIVLGRCSQPNDEDDDGFQDGCDTCSFANASDLDSNDLAQEREQITNPSIATIADDCDPVPIVRVPPQNLVAISQAAFTNLDVTDGVGLDETVDIPQDRWIGKQTANEPAGPALPQAFGYRQCDCFHLTSGVPLKLKDCVDSNLGAQCSAKTPLTTAEWSVPTLTLLNDAPLLNAAGFAPALAFFRGVAQPMSLRWRWRDDLENGNVTGQGTCGADVLSCKAHVALFTTTQGPPASSRDLSANLRDVFQIVDGPGFGLVIPTSFSPPAPCQGIPCLEWFNAKVGLVSPELGDFPSLFEGPVVMTKTGAVVAALIEPGQAYNISANVSSGVAALIDDTQAMWLTPVEAAHRIRRSPGRGGVQAVGFPRDFTASSSAEVVLGTSAGLSGGRRVELETLDLTVETGARPRPRTDVRALFSGVEEALYMVGGRLGEGRAAQAIWRYTLHDRAWQIIGENAGVVPSSQVRAVTYDQKNARLYVLDLDDEVQPKGPLRLARLTRYDLRASTAVILATWPYLGLFDQLWLAATDDGDVLLIAGKSHSFSVWRLRPTSTGFAYEGRHVGSRALLGQPVMGERHPVIALKGKKPNTIQYQTLVPELFVGHQPCASL